MTPEHVIQIIEQTLYFALQMAAPFLILSLVVGLVISVLQSMTHVQEMTLSFVPKMLVVGFALALFLPWMLKMMTKFTHNLWISQWDKVTYFIQYVIQ